MLRFRQFIESMQLCGFAQMDKGFLLIVVSRKIFISGSILDNEGMFSYCSDLELLGWKVLAVRSLGLPGSAVVLVKGVPEGRF